MRCLFVHKREANRISTPVVQLKRLAKAALASRSVETALFDYRLPDAAIAQVPIEPRDAARLLVCDTMSDRRFGDLPDLLYPGDLLVVNRTRVRSARVRGHKVETGGAVELLVLSRLDDLRWRALIRPARRIRAGTHLQLGSISGRVLADPVRGEVEIELTTDGDIEDEIADAGETPLPPYIHTELENPERYQTVFAKTIGSAAAPTAALHFTPELLGRLREREVGIAEVELEIGLDTFRPINTDLIGDHEMHTESWVVDDGAARQIAATRHSGGSVIAVGTTVVRTLESAAAGDGLVAPGRGDTSLFISPGYQMRVVDSMITNFHAPRTTLIVMIAAMLGDRWRDVYEHAVSSGYRFLSFGDAMFIETMINQRDQA